MAKLERALPDLFVFVLDPRIPPTNNAAERGLREVVVHRKMCGALRSEKTTHQMGRHLYVPCDMEANGGRPPGRDGKIRLDGVK